MKRNKWVKKREADLRRHFMRITGDWGQRIEPGMGSTAGMPDMILLLGGGTVAYLELKATSRDKLRPSQVTIFDNTREAQVPCYVAYLHTGPFEKGTRQEEFCIALNRYVGEGEDVRVASLSKWADLLMIVRKDIEINCKVFEPSDVVGNFDLKRTELWAIWKEKGWWKTLKD